MKETVSLRKMKHTGAPKLQYTLCDIPMNDLIGGRINLNFSGAINCIYCSRAIKKTFNQGYCFPCAKKLARCDICIVKPELCHFDKGTCREPEWGEEHCQIPHLVYLANTSGLKVGITRLHQKLDRWGDQGAVSALELAIVPRRKVAGDFELQLKKLVSDKTDWRALIKGVSADVDLLSERERFRVEFEAEWAEYFVNTQEFDKVQRFEYPVQCYPEKATTHALEKVKQVEGVFEGIRGQYLFISGKALNVRKYQGYEVSLETLD